jgi:3D (Asp-Asp-Asp) domain-containing protein
MRPLLSRVSLLALCLFIVGCASRPLPKYETPIARRPVQHVRTTAYTDSESDHIQYSNHNALGGTLQSGAIHSAAADWSRWPAGTIFRIRETGELYRVDDYGWALSGTNTIDLYKPSRATMNAWGTRGVTIENLQWGDPKQSLSVLRERSHFRHVQRMIKELEDRMDELLQPLPATEPMVAAITPISLNTTPTARTTVLTPPVAAAPSPQVAPRATSATGGYRGVARDPFFANGSR